MNKGRNKVNQPPTGKGKKQSSPFGQGRKLNKRAEVLKAGNAEQNIGSAEEEEASRTERQWVIRNGGKQVVSF